MLLAIANPVFKSLFFGPIMVTGKKVKVNILGTTYEAFSTLIKFIYSVPDYLPLTADVQKLNDVLKIAESYHVMKLANEVRMTIERFHIKRMIFLGQSKKKVPWMILSALKMFTMLPSTSTVSTHTRPTIINS